MKTDLEVEPRRGFLRNVALSIFVMLTVPLASCDFSSIEAQIAAYLPTILDALTGILSLIPQTAIIATIVGYIKIAVADGTQAYKDWSSAPASEKATFLEKLSLAVTDIITEFSNLSSQIPGSSLAIKLIQLVLSTLAAFLPALPTPSAATIAEVRGRYAPEHVKFLEVHASEVSVTPVKRSRNEFIKEYNADMVEGGHPELAKLK